MLEPCEKIEFLKLNSKYSVHILSTDNKEKQFILMICWVTQFQKNEIFKASDFMVDVLTNLLDQERKKRKAS